MDRVNIFDIPRRRGRKKRQSDHSRFAQIGPGAHNMDFWSKMKEHLVEKNTKKSLIYMENINKLCGTLRRSAQSPDCWEDLQIHMAFGRHAHKEI